MHTLNPGRPSLAVLSLVCFACSASGTGRDGSQSSENAATGGQGGAQTTGGSAATTGGGGSGGQAASASGGTSGTSEGGTTSSEAGTSSGGAGGSYTDPIVDEASFPVNEWTKTLGWARDEVPIQGEGLLQDPVRPNDLDAFYTDSSPNTRHVMKSTDYGLTWESIEQTSVEGSPWGVAIDPNPARDPDEPPTMYAPAGYGARGLWKSTDGGVTWSNLFANCVDGVMPKPGGGTVTFPPDKNSLHNDFYQVAILADDPPNHILLTYHEPGPGEAVLGESKDGGVTWEIHATPWGYSDYVVGIDATTWLIVSQAYGSGDGIYRTTTAGRVDDEISPDAWTKVDDGKHDHGAFTPFRDSNGDLYFPTTSGIRRSTDAGATWTSAYGPSTGAVIGTEQYLYAFPNFVRASRDNLSSWEAYSTKPSDWGHGNPPFSMASAMNGEHAVIVGANYGDSLNGVNGDVWRYKEE